MGGCCKERSFSLWKERFSFLLGCSVAWHKLIDLQTSTFGQIHVPLKQGLRDRQTESDSRKTPLGARKGLF